MGRYQTTVKEKIMIPKDGKVIAKFSATWCGPCKMLSKVLETIDLDVPVIEIDIDEQGSLAAEYGIRGVPTMILFDNGKEIKRQSGMMQAGQIKEFAIANT